MVLLECSFSASLFRINGYISQLVVGLILSTGSKLNTIDETAALRRPTLVDQEDTIFMDRNPGRN